MQNLEVISVNIWQIVISLLNLLLLFLVVKKFLFGPIRKILAKRQREIDVHYDQAKQAELDAQRDRAEWESKLAGADAQAEAILQSATENAQYRSEKIVAEAQERAQSIVRVAQTEAELERKKATEGIKREIVEVSGALAEKMLEREIKADDHRALIDSFIEEIGDGDE